MLWIMFKFFLIYLVVVFFLGIFRTWRAITRVQKTVRQSAEASGQKKSFSSENVVEAEYKVIDQN